LIRSLAKEFVVFQLPIFVFVNTPDFWDRLPSGATGQKLERLKRSHETPTAVNRTSKDSFDAIQKIFKHLLLNTVLL